MTSKSYPDITGQEVKMAQMSKKRANDEKVTSGKSEKSSTVLQGDTSLADMSKLFNTPIRAPSPEQNTKPFEKGGENVLVPVDPMSELLTESKMPLEEEKVQVGVTSPT
jgi:hypothetical protein